MGTFYVHLTFCFCYASAVGTREIVFAYENKTENAPTARYSNSQIFTTLQDRRSWSKVNITPLYLCFSISMGGCYVLLSPDDSIVNRLTQRYDNCAVVYDARCLWGELNDRTWKDV